MMVNERREGSEAPHRHRPTLLEEELLQEERRATCCGRPIVKVDSKTFYFLLFIVVEGMAILGTTMWAMSTLRYPLDDTTRPSFAYGCTIMFNCFVVVYFVIHGTLRERKEELYAFLFASVGVGAYVIYNFFTGIYEWDVRLTRLILVASAQPFNIAGGVYVLRNMDWLAFHVAGANLNVQTLYKTYCRFLTLLIFDFQIAVSLAILEYLTASLTKIQVTLAVVGLALSVLWLALAMNMAKYEVRWSLIPFALFSLAEPSFIIYKIVTIATEWSTHKVLVTYPVFVIGGFAIVLRICVLLYARFVVQNFGKGLKEHLLREHVPLMASPPAAPSESSYLLPKSRSSSEA